MAKYLVQGVHRDQYAHVIRAGRWWPSDAWTEIGVLDDPAAPDPMIDVVVPAGQAPRKMVNPTILSQASFAALQADGRISIRPVGMVDQNDAAKRIQELEAQLERWGADNRGLQLEASKQRQRAQEAEDGLHDLKGELEQANAALRARATESALLPGEHADATVPDAPPPATGPASGPKAKKVKGRPQE